MNYEVKEYVAVIDRIPTYFKVSMDLLKPEVRDALFYKHSTILTKVKDSVPARYKEGANVKNSIIADGCVIDGTVENSILSVPSRLAKAQSSATPSSWKTPSSWTTHPLTTPSPTRTSSFSPTER